VPENQPDFISHVAHKLRTPLTVVISTVNNLLDGAFGSLNPEQRRWLEKLRSHTGVFETLMNDILEQLRSQQTAALSSPTPPDAAKPSPVLLSPAHLFAWERVPRVLVVDDEPDILDVVEEGMTMKGMECVRATSGAEALDVAMASKPDVILMDVHLNDANGVDVCQQIKARMTTFVPVLLVTGQDQLDRSVVGGKNDPDDILMKPFQMQELYSRVTSMLRIKKLYENLESAMHKAA
jgi:PleD family two-component response regulator